MKLPKIPVPVNQLIGYITDTEKSVLDALGPYRAYESKLREIYAQEPENKILNDPKINTIQIYNSNLDKVNVRARSLKEESNEEKDRYILPLSDENRLLNGAPAITKSLKDFRNNFNIFSESSLVDLDWSNVVVAGSAAATALLPVQPQHSSSKRALRDYYHEKLAPASDVDLFLYGLTEAQAIEKVKQIEQCVRDSILYETTVIRTKYAITIASQYPCRHIQVVLRIYRNISEILSGFDVDSSCVAYDGSNVYATPRAIGAFMTQANVVDLSRRSPSYENRLFKYSRRGFEVYCPMLDRSRVDPTIFERSFGRVLGLARLLVLEKLPTPMDRDNYITKRREERGRPTQWWLARHRTTLRGNIKEKEPEDVAEWAVVSDEASNYHTFTVPYGPKFYAKKLEKLFFTKDLLLNAEWNKPKNREVHLHRHPAFFGGVKDVLEDCCGCCPEPITNEEAEIDQKEAEIYIKGKLTFLTDNPGRQQIGSFNPLTSDDWTDMAYVENTSRLCQAIVDNDLEQVEDWCDGEGANINCRDHTGRTPLQLAAQCASPEIVQCLIDHGARLISRMVDGKTALHIAAIRGNVDIVKALLKKSEQNEEIEAEEQARRRKESKQNDNVEGGPTAIDREFKVIPSDVGSTTHETDDKMTQGSFVLVEDSNEPSPELDTEGDSPDIYDINAIAWDCPTSPLHLAIMAGRVEIVRTLVDEFGADVMLPIKIKDDYSNEPQAAILTLVLAAKFSPNAGDMMKQLLKSGASCLQADMHERTALHFIAKHTRLNVLETLFKYDEPAAKAALSHLILPGPSYSCAPLTALLLVIAEGKEETALKLLDYGAPTCITRDSFARAYQRKNTFVSNDPDDMSLKFATYVTQPIFYAIEADMFQVVDRLLNESNVNVLNQGAEVLLRHGVQAYSRIASRDPGSLLDVIRERIKLLNKYLEQEDKGVTFVPRPLQPDEHYLSGLARGTYSEWLARGDLERAKRLMQSMQAAREEEEQAPHTVPEEEREGKDQKRAAIEAAAKGFEKLEERLLGYGAKTFSELHPDIEIPFQQQNDYQPAQTKPKEDESYETQIKFMVSDSTNAKKEGYRALFEAAWKGDTDSVKAMTMRSWKLSEFVGAQLREQQDLSDVEMDPLPIAVQDHHGFSPFALAVCRGHLTLASTIIEIATIQYRPEEDEPEYIYSLGSHDDSDNSDSESENDGDVHIATYKQLVDQQYTVENIAALGDTIDSRVSPQTMVDWNCDAWLFFENAEEAVQASVADFSADCHQVLQPLWHGSMSKYSQQHLLHVLETTRSYQTISLTEYAVSRNDMSKFKFLLSASIDLFHRRKDENSTTDFCQAFCVRSTTFDYAARLGRTEMLGELLRVTGAELPLKRMMKTSGVEIEDPPKYYQGLTVYGRKRKDWANHKRGPRSEPDMENQTPPLLRAAFALNIESTDFLLSDAPFRRYKEFVEAHGHEKAIEALNEQAGGAEQAISQWLNARSHLAVHGTVLAPPRQGDVTKQLRLLLDTMPDALNGLDRKKRTPLHLAFQFCRQEAAKFLIDEGADQKALDQAGEHILHSAMRGSIVTRSYGTPRFENGSFKAMVSLVDQPRRLLVQRSFGPAGSLTPLALYLHSLNFVSVECAEFLKEVLECSGGADLEIMDGSGDYPLHFVARKGWTLLVKLFAAHNPALLYWENAAGMTPMEIANAALLNERMQESNTLEMRSMQPQTLRTRNETFFLKDRKSDYEKNGALNTWHALRTSLLASTNLVPPPKRKLVSLFDAMEVSKRRAYAKADAQDSGSRRHLRRHNIYQTGEAEAAEELRDEVDHWIETIEADYQWVGIRFKMML